ncbi:MAG: FAD:protein FMN transferase [Bacteriovoracales bacterium]|nr:FAD:protein FMN transferase [Bacteriovoracales bacterium]
MGTTYTVKYYPAPSSPKRDDIKRRVDAKLLEINRSLSTYLPNSEISRFNREGHLQEFSLSPLFQKALRLSFEVFEQSGGFFDPSIGPLVGLFGHGPKRHRRPPAKANIRKALAWVGLHKYRISKDFKRIQKPHKKAYLDFSASAKGLGVDETAKLLETFGIHRYMVEIGGEIRVGSGRDKPWRLAVERPLKKERSIQTTVELENASLATSGNYRNTYTVKGQRYSHIIDPHSGKTSPGDLLSVSVIYDNCTQADAWATALLAMGKKKALDTANRLGLKVLLIASTSTGLQELRGRHWPKP